jgi:hypothetical protein
MFSKSTYVAEFTQCRATLSHTNGACHDRHRDGPCKLQWRKCLQPPSIESDCGHGPAPDYEIHAISYASYASITSSEPRKLVATFFAFPRSNATHCIMLWITTARIRLLRRGPIKPTRMSSTRTESPSYTISIKETRCLWSQTPTQGYGNIYNVIDVDLHEEMRKELMKTIPWCRTRSVRVILF